MTGFCANESLYRETVKCAAGTDRHQMGWSIYLYVTASGQMRSFVAHLSAVSVMHMKNGSTAQSKSSQRWLIFNYLAASLAVVAVASLLTMLVLKWLGSSAWVGLNWIAMLGLPLAFLMMGVSVIQAVSRRRKL